jgi:release factor glutamine methyltransferase
VACARANGVDALVGDLDEPLPPALRGAVDIMTAVVPYVPTEALVFLPRDVVAFEPRRALDGGREGVDVLMTVVGCGARWLAPGGWLLLEIGGHQAPALSAGMEAAGFGGITVWRDDEGDDRAIEGRRLSS